MITLCTLFNTNYFDKGYTMYESIERYTKDYVLYALCMDDRCYEILSDLNCPRFVPIKLSDFETPQLLKLKAERSMGEYCWTCSSCLVDYIMRTYNPEYCAYIDSDLYFYDDVNVVLREMQERNASVMITGHRFNWYERKENEWKVGKYCVEFNTFKNDANGRMVLNIWMQQCIDYCKTDGDGVHWADQKYLDNWCDDYDFCVETNNLGAGVAPWNIAQYKMLTRDGYGPVKVKCRGKEYKMLFYHYQNLNYLDEKRAETHTAGYWGVDFDLVRSAYSIYMKHILQTKDLLRMNYGVDVLLKSHPGLKGKSHESLSIFHIIHHVLNIKHVVGFVKQVLFVKLPTLIHGNRGIIEITRNPR